MELSGHDFSGAAGVETPVQSNLRTDEPDENVKHTSSALFACPPGLIDEGDRWGSGLFG